MLVNRVLGQDHPAAKKVIKGLIAYNYGKEGNKEMEMAYMADTYESVKKGQGQTPEQINLEGIKEKS